MGLKIFIDEYSQPSRALLCFMIDSGLKYETVELEIAQGDQRSDDMTLINPNKKLPAIQDTLNDGTIINIFESAAIMRYLADNYLPEDNEYYPRNDLILRAKIDERLTYYHKVVRPGTRSFYGKILAPLQGTTKYFNIEHENKVALATSAKIQEDLKKNGGFFVKAGTRTIADYLILNDMEQYTWGGLTLNHLTDLVKWMEWMMQSEGCQRAHAKYKWFIHEMDGEIVTPYDINMVKYDYKP
jgi:glutathione S-transferase